MQPDAERHPSAPSRRSRTQETSAYFNPYPLNSHQQPVLLDRLFGDMVKKSLNRSHGPFLPGRYSNPRVRQAFQGKIPDASEAVRMGSRYRKSADISAVREK
jgi:hypothetical protein